MSLPEIKYLNQTCVEIATANFTFFDSKAGGNLTACSIDTTTPDFNTNSDNNLKTRICLYFMFVQFIIIIFVLSLRVQRRRLIRQLRHLPSHQLHRELEDLNSRYLSKKSRKAYIDKINDGGGRYKNVVYAADPETRTRRLVIIEDMNEEPSEREIQIYTQRFIVRGKKATRLPTLEIPYFDGASVANASRAVNVGTGVLVVPSYVAVPEPAVVRGEQDAAPPAYTRLWNPWD